jgi:2-oxoglutarate ferredoxin oxidoreductase subunit beta
LKPFNPIAVALSMGATFIARGFSGDIEFTVELIKQAIKHKGYALVDIFQPCVTFNKINTFKWFKENSYKLDENYDPSNKMKAYEIAHDESKYALGIIYQSNERTSFESQLNIFKKEKTPLYERYHDLDKLEKFINAKK